MAFKLGMCQQYSQYTVFKLIPSATFACMYPAPDAINIYWYDMDSKF